MSTTPTVGVSPPITVSGNVAGDIIVGNYNFKVNTNYGTIIYPVPQEPAVKPRDAAPPLLRAPLDFVDRASELAQLAQWIAANQAVTVHGPDGTGKTTLLHQSANDTAARALPHGVVLVESIDFEGQLLKTDDIVQRLFDALYESTPPLKVTASTALTYLSNIRLLAILDNLQLPSTDAVRAVIDLFPKSPVLFALPQLPGGNLTRSIKLGALARVEALTLLSSVSNIAITNVNHAALDAICDLLADVPLAIVTAANTIREKDLPLDQARATLAAARPSDDDPLQAGIARAYALAYLSLSDNERQVLAMAAASPGVSVDAEWIRIMLNTAVWVDPVIARLKAQGLLHANSPRLRIDPGLRAIARQGTNEALVRDRLIAYLKEQLPTRSLDSEFCADELGNLLGSIEWAAQQNRWADVIALSRAIDPYLTLHGLWDAWRIVLNQMLAGARAAGDAATEAWARHQLGTHAAGIGETSQAIRFLRQARDMRLDLGDTNGAAYSQHNLDILIPPVLPPTEHDGPLFGSMRWLVAFLGVLVLLMLLLSDQNVRAAIGNFLSQGNKPPATRAVTAQKPSFTQTATSSRTATPPSTFTPTPTSTPTDTPTPCGPPSSGWVIYIVQAGDTLFSLAPRAGTTVEVLMQANCLNSSIIRVDQRLYVPHLPLSPTPTFTPTPSPPNIVSAVALPNDGSYQLLGLRIPQFFQRCPPSTIIITASVTSQVGIANVAIDYRYEPGTQNGWQSVDAVWLSSGEYRATLDANRDNQAWQALQGKTGQIRWHVLATDTRNLSTIGDDQTIDIRFCSFGTPTVTSTPTPIFNFTSSVNTGDDVSAQSAPQK